MSFEPTLSVEAARNRPSSSGWRPANPPKPVAPVDAAATRRRSTIASAVASETPAAAYVLLSPFRGPSLRGGLDEQFPVKLRPTLWAVGHELDDRLADLDRVARVRKREQLAERSRLQLRIV